MFDSIKLKLIIFFLAVFSVVFTTLGFFLYFELREIVFGSVDDHMYSEITLLAGILSKEVEHGHIEEGIYEITEAASGEYAHKLSGHYYQLVDNDGNVIGRSPSLKLADESLPIVEKSEGPIYGDILVGPNNLPLRVVSQTFTFMEMDGKYMEVTFQAADSMEESFYVLKSFRNIILIVLPLIFLISIVGIYYITSWALRTVNAFSEKVGRITARNLNERIEEGEVDLELKPLARSFNTMLGHLETAFLRQREFLSDASHELRTPTSVIKSLCDVTLRRERNDAEYKEALGTIDKTSMKMAEIIERILQASRLESKTFQMNMENVELPGLLTDIVDLIRPTAEQRGVELKLEEWHGHGMVIGDRERLTEAFVNIIENAVKYTASGGSVTVGVDDTSQYEVVRITDTGIGISSEDRDVIFERFYRVDKSREAVPGTGLGLSIVKAIIEAHHGKIDVESEEGKGTTFKVSLLKE
ncbi:MAG: ATP-binding protein [Thermodesulfobacteriota bacterium]